MIKKVLFLTITCFSLNVFSSTYAYVDLKLALETVKDGKKAKEKLEKEAEEKREIIAKREKELQNLTSQFEKKSLVMSNDKKMKEQQKIQKKMMEYRQFVQQTETSMQKKQMELTKPIIDSMKDVVEEIAKKKNFDLVYEKNQGSVLFAKDQVSITNDVIKRYNEIHK
jgi:outer membrane protein